MRCRFGAVRKSAEANDAIIVPAFETKNATIANQAAAGDVCGSTTSRIGIQ